MAGFDLFRGSRLVFGQPNYAELSTHYNVVIWRIWPEDYEVMVMAEGFATFCRARLEAGQS